MKQIERLALAGLAVLTLATGCRKDQNDFDTPQANGGSQNSQEPGENNDANKPGVVVPGNVGYLDVSGLVLGVTSDTEIMVSNPADRSADNTEAATAAPKESATPVEASDSYQIRVFSVSDPENTDPDKSWSGTYAQLKQLPEGKLSLQPGRYQIVAVSHAEIPPVEWEQPRYAGSTEFTIVKKITTSVNDLVCRLANIKTTVELSADLKNLFQDTEQEKLTTTIALGEAKAVFGRDETRAAYFGAVEMSNTLNVTLKGSYNIKGEGETAVYKPVTMNQTINNVKAGQYRRISIQIEHASEGNVQLTLTVETWAYDGQIDVDVMSSQYQFKEEVIPDVEEEISHPLGPQLMLDDEMVITDIFKLTSKNFDTDYTPARCNKIISLIATMQDGATLADARCVIDSDNEEFLKALETAGYADKTVTLNENIGEYGIIKDDASGRRIIKGTDAGMWRLFEFAGTHKVKFILTDSQNRRTYTTLTIQVIKGEVTEVGPAITGFDFDTRHNITEESKPTVRIDIASKTGITGFIVEIHGGNVLPDKELGNFNLASRMDLINPATPDMKAGLIELGFIPAEGSIAGATELTFDISNFMPMLHALSPGNCDFKLIVTDASGTNEKTIQLKVVK